MNSITNVRVTFTGGTEEERRPIIDAIMLLLVEHGCNVTGMQEWDEGLDQA